MKSLADYKVGDLLLMTTRMRLSTEIRGAEVTAVNFNNLGGVTYIGANVPSAHLPTGSGWFKPEEIGTKPYGLVKVEKYVPPAPKMSFRRERNDVGGGYGRSDY